MDDTMLDLQRQYQDDLRETEQDYQRRRINIEQDYRQSVEIVFRSMVVGVASLVSEYAEMIKASPFWNPL